jgi:hypothetical protein
MTFKNIEELKTFILWAKKEQLAAFQVGEVSFTFSDARIMTESLNAPTAQEQVDLEAAQESKSDYQPNSKTWEDVDQSQDDDEDLLYYST